MLRWDNVKRLDPSDHFLRRADRSSDGGGHSVSQLHNASDMVGGALEGCKLLSPNVYPIKIFDDTTRVSNGSDLAHGTSFPFLLAIGNHIGVTN